MRFQRVFASLADFLLCSSGGYGAQLENHRVCREEYSRDARIKRQQADQVDQGVRLGAVSAPAGRRGGYLDNRFCIIIRKWYVDNACNIYFCFLNELLGVLFRYLQVYFKCHLFSNESMQ